MSPLVETEIECPHCGEPYHAVVDTSQGDHSTIEDCPVCCRPIAVSIRCSAGEIHEVSAEAD